MTSSQIDVPAASFPPLSRSGVLMGLSGGQLALLAVPVLVVGAAFIAGDPASAIGLFPFAVPVAAVATTSWKGRSLLSRINILGTYLVRRRLGQTRAVVDTSKPVEVGRIAVPGAVGERLKVLSKRATLINRAIALCVLCGLLVSLVVAALFVSSALQLELAVPIAVVFVVALLSLAAALVYFLREVFIATAALSFGGVRGAK